MDKCVVITGSNRGIGLELVRKYASMGYRVFACMRNLEEATQIEFDRLQEKYNIIITPICFELADQNEMKNAFKKIKEQTDGVDILVNNAGVSEVKVFGMLKEEDLQKQMSINFIAPIIFSQYIAKLMRKRTNACIINIGSVSGLKNEKGGLAYGASKAALIYATKTMANELAQYGIRVNCISPGFINTDMWKDRKPELIQQMIKDTPLNRQGTARDIANMVYFITSSDASYVTGENIVVNGGR